ncbi:hypothetical protein Taro_014539 [Colocasia esculenta]|uniref:Tetratricopeptide repeat protein 33 n=1 Tax=Colocasia esculenta TaxID=4460 RepID=A0A843UF42_COLES|nr:hypothetical protein [Colocasia esculenta]
MKMVWKKKENDDRGKKRTRPVDRNLPFDAAEETEAEAMPATELQDSEQNSSPVGALAPDSLSPNPEKLAESFRSQGDQLAEEGKYREALGKWEAALMLTPDKAVLHEQKAQILLELGDAWNALKAASRATQLEPSWAEGWVTLARAQLNFGEPEASVESFDRALALKPNSEDAQVDRQIALNLVKKRKQLRLSGSGPSEGRFVVRDKDEHEECRPPLHI